MTVLAVVIWIARLSAFGTLSTLEIVFWSINVLFWQWLESDDIKRDIRLIQIEVAKIQSDLLKKS